MERNIIIQILLMKNKSNVKRMWKVSREGVGSKMNCSEPLYVINEENVKIRREKNC